MGRVDRVSQPAPHRLCSPSPLPLRSLPPPETQEPNDSPAEGSLRGFLLSKRNKTRTRRSDERLSRRPFSFFLLFLSLDLNGRLVSAKTLCVPYVLICDFNRGLLPFFFFFWSLVFESFVVVVLFSTPDQTETRPSPRNVQEKLARKEEAVLWTSDTFHVIVCAICNSFIRLLS